ncbi:MAG: hypothetical protein HY204_11235 [Nitrospirae bacterium]|nr:hypothetical protein [Nitrospirota bacterium]
MTDVAALEGKIKRLKKTLSEKRQKASDAEPSLELRAFQKRLKRLQRRRRVLLNWMQRGTKGKTEKAEKEAKPAEKPSAKPEPAAAKEAKAG